MGAGWTKRRKEVGFLLLCPLPTTGPLSPERAGPSEGAGRHSVLTAASSDSATICYLMRR